jgi:hypothetical protein
MSTCNDFDPRELEEWKREHEEWALCPVPLRVDIDEADWQRELAEAIKLTRDMMMLRGPISPLMRDVIVATQDRILAVIQYSLNGPVVTRLEPQVQY